MRPAEKANASKTCHRCGHVPKLKEAFRCSSCGIEYNRDLNAAINIAHALTRRMGWEDILGEPADAAGALCPAERWKFPTSVGNAHSEN